MTDYITKLIKKPDATNKIIEYIAKKFTYENITDISWSELLKNKILHQSTFNNIVFGLMEHEKFNDRDKLFLCGNFDKIYFDHDEHDKNRQYFIHIFLQKIKCINVKDFMDLLIYLYPTRHILDIFGIVMIKCLSEKLEYDNFNKVLKIMVRNISSNVYCFNTYDFVSIILDLYKNKKINYHYMHCNNENCLLGLLSFCYNNCINNNECEIFKKFNELIKLLINENDITNFDIESFLFCICWSLDKMSYRAVKYVAIIVDYAFKHIIKNEFWLNVSAQKNSFIGRLYGAILQFPKNLIEKINLKIIIPFLVKYIDNFDNPNNKIMFIIKFNKYIKNIDSIMQDIEIDYDDFVEIDEIRTKLFIINNYKELCLDVDIRWYEHMIDRCKTKRQLKLVTKLICKFMS